MLEALQLSLHPAALVGFVVYMIGAVAMLSLFKFIYTRITPHREYVLIREGNVAAAIALAGAIIGFALPTSNIIANSISVLDFLVWTVIAGVVQLFAFFMVSMILKDLPERIKKGDLAAGIYVAAVAISIGLLNAACMTPSA
jgi:putative membrane protein